MKIRIKEVVKKRSNYQPMLIIALFSLLVIFFVKMNKFYLLSGADFGFHRLRLLGLVQSIDNGDFFPKVNYIMANGLGYGVSMFYGQWFFYFPALLMTLLNFTFTRAWLSLYVLYYIIVITLNFFIGRKFSMNILRSFIFSLLLAFNPLITSIVNGDLPFAICLMLTPSVFYCLWRILYFQENRYVFLAVLVTIVVNTHILSTIVLAFICLLWIVLHLNKFNLSKVSILLKAILLAMLLSASFWMPLLEQMVFQKLKGSGLSDAFRYVSVHGLNDIFINSLNDSIGSITRFPTISLVGLILFFYILFSYFRSDEFSKKTFVLISFLIIFSSDMFPWVLFGHTTIGAVQFVGRYLLFVLVLIIVISTKQKTIPNAVFVFCLLLTFSSTISQQMLPEISNEEALNEYFDGEFDEVAVQKYHDLNDVDDLLDGDKQVNGVAGGEYLNTSTDLSLNNDNKVKSDNANFFNIKKEYGSISFDYELKNDSETANIILPFLWYKGYVSDYSHSGKGTQPILNYQYKNNITDNGKASIDVTKSGHVHVYYSGTVIQKVSSILSFICWLGLFFIIFKKITIYFSNNRIH